MRPLSTRHIRVGRRARSNKPRVHTARFGLFKFLLSSAQLKPHDGRDESVPFAHDVVSTSIHFLAVFPGAHSQTPLSDGAEFERDLLIPLRHLLSQPALRGRVWRGHSAKNFAVNKGANNRFETSLIRRVDAACCSRVMACLSLWLRCLVQF